MAIEKIEIPHADLPYEQEPIYRFKDFDWSKATKWDAVSFARAKGFKETGMSVNEIALLYDCLERRRPRTIVELGRNYGTSTRLFLQYLLRYGGKLDSWDLKHWDGFLETMAANGYLLEPETVNELVNGSTVRLVTAHSMKSPVHPDFQVDFLLIDTEHGLEHALGEYMRWREYLTSGAMIAFHDSDLPAVARAIDIVKEVESSGSRDRILREYVNERVDGFGIHVLEWRG